MKIILKHIYRNIKEKKWRSVLIVLSLVIATTVFVLNLTLPDELVLKIQQTYRSIYGDVDIAMNTVEEFKLEDVELGDKEIRYTNTLVLEGLYNDKPMIIRGLNIEEAKEFKMLNSDVPALTGNQIVISEKQAKDFGFSQGQKIKVLFHNQDDTF